MTRRRALRRLSLVLIVTGALLIADAALTLIWQEPLSAFIAWRSQQALDEEFARLRADPADGRFTRLVAGLPVERRIAAHARRLLRDARPGGAVGRIRIRRMGLDEVFVHGTDAPALRRGPGHYPETPLPGAGGTVGIAGHRTTYGAPFRDLDALRPGDPIEIEMPYASFTYRVERTRIVDPSATWVVRRVGYERIVLTACHPLYSAEQRIVVFARLASEQATSRSGARSAVPPTPVRRPRQSQRARPSTPGSSTAPKPPPRRAARGAGAGATRYE